MRIVTTHKNTDFDALASTIAASIIFPDAVPVLPNTVNPNVKAFLALHKDLLSIKTVDEVDLSSVTSLIVVKSRKNLSKIIFQKSFCSTITHTKEIFKRICVARKKWALMSP